MNNILERLFYLRLRTINDRSLDVDQTTSSVDLNQLVAKVNNRDIGQCFIKRINDTRLVVTVAPAFVEDKHDVNDNSSDDEFQPLNRSRANTWHHTKRGDGLLCPQPLENSTSYYRTMSVGSTPYNTTDMLWDTENKLDHNLSIFDSKFTPSRLNYSSKNLHDFPTNLAIDIYDCRQEDVENVLMFDSHLVDQTINDYTDDDCSSSSSSSIKSDIERVENLYFSSRKKIIFDEPGNKINYFILWYFILCFIFFSTDPLLVDKYLKKIHVIYDRTFVTTVFHALHLGLNVRHVDIQHAINQCQKRSVTFDITDYIKVPLFFL